MLEKVTTRTRGGQNQFNIKFHYKGSGITSTEFSDSANQLYYNAEHPHANVQRDKQLRRKERDNNTLFTQIIPLTSLSRGNKSHSTGGGGQ
jgi:hypothetical protein